MDKIPINREQHKENYNSEILNYIKQKQNEPTQQN